MSVPTSSISRENEAMLEQAFHRSPRATLHIYQAGGAAGREQGNQPMTEWQSTTLHSFLWGFIRQDLCITSCCLGDGTRTGIEELKLEWTPLQRLAVVVTLGIWAPMTVSWRCAKQVGPRGELS
jgi:hypothetical protein